MNEEATGWQIATWLWGHKDEIWQKLSEVYKWFRGAKRRPGILILGPGGVGKTTLGKLLAGEYNVLLDVPSQYDESLSIERYCLSDAPDVEIVVPPGQEHRRQATWSDLHADIVAGKFRGIIFLAAFGYHTLGISYKSHVLYRHRKAEFLEKYLEDRRTEEMTILRQLVPHVRACQHRFWMLTFIGKRDLWWDQQDAVRRHYTEGDYQREIAKMRTDKGPSDFRHECLFGSLSICNFDTSLGAKERLKKNCAGYDLVLHVGAIRKLFETVATMKDWEAAP